MKIYIHNVAERLKDLAPDNIYEEMHEKDFPRAFALDKGHYLSDLNLDYWIYASMIGEENYHNIVGKIQYRKWFTTQGDTTESPLNKEKLEYIFGPSQNYDIICTVTKLPINNRQWYNNWHASFDLKLIENIIKQVCHDNISTKFTNYLNSSDALIYANCYIAKSSVIKEYYEWMFPLLKIFIDNSSFRHYPDPYQQRAPGYIAERLFSFWVLHQPDLNKFFAPMNDHTKDFEKKIRFSAPK